MASTDSSAIRWANDPEIKAWGTEWWPITAQSESVTFSPNVIEVNAIATDRIAPAPMPAGGEVGGDITAYFDLSYHLRRLIESCHGARMGTVDIRGNPVPEGVIATGNSTEPFALEKEIVHDDGVTTYTRFWDCYCSGYTISGTANDLVEATFNIGGSRLRKEKWEEWGIGNISDENAPLPGATYRGPHNGGIVRADRTTLGIARIKGNQAIPLPAYCVTDFTLTVNSNVESRYCLGVEGASGQRLGAFDVTLTANVYFVDDMRQFFTDLVDNGEVRVNMAFKDQAGGRMVFWMNRCRVTQADVLLTGPGADVLMALTFAPIKASYSTPLYWNKTN